MIFFTFQAGETPLHESIRLSRVSGSQLLLRCGASVNVAGPGSVTPLMMACAGGDDTAPLVETLLDYEADPNAVDKNGWNAIRWGNAGPHFPLFMVC